MKGVSGIQEIGLCLENQVETWHPLRSVTHHLLACDNM